MTIQFCFDQKVPYHEVQITNLISDAIVTLFEVHSFISCKLIHWFNNTVILWSNFTNGKLSTTIAAKSAPCYIGINQDTIC